MARIALAIESVLSDDTPRVAANRGLPGGELARMHTSDERSGKRQKHERAEPDENK